MTSAALQRCCRRCWVAGRRRQRQRQGQGQRRRLRMRLDNARSVQVTVYRCAREPGTPSKRLALASRSQGSRSGGQRLAGRLWPRGYTVCFCRNAREAPDHHKRCQLTAAAATAPHLSLHLKLVLPPLPLLSHSHTLSCCSPRPQDAPGRLEQPHPQARPEGAPARRAGCAARAGADATGRCRSNGWRRLLTLVLVVQTEVCYGSFGVLVSVCYVCWSDLALHRFSCCPLPPGIALPELLLHNAPPPLCCRRAPWLCTMRTWRCSAACWPALRS